MTDVLSTKLEGVNLSEIFLPNQWVLYLYDKQLFKKIANRPGFKAKPHKEICKIKTLNDIVFILQLMEIDVDSKTVGSSYKRINLDMNDYIIMRDGIEPIWEDPKNSNGGTFTIKLPHSKGYDIWSKFITYMIGETLTYDMSHINGITVSYISDYNNQSPINNAMNNYTYIKVWDGKSDRTREQFLSILPFEINEKIKNESIMYSPNNKKKDFGERKIIDKLSHNKRNNGRERSGFKTTNRFT
uniref:Uncharacterized protein n=1 Tax=viral metagenome TaxID=1070528 RepID=A0A6C0LRM9_9ZZZZ